MITEMNQLKTLAICHANVSSNFMVENLIRIKIGIMINVGVSARIRKKIMRAKFTFGILLYVLEKMINVEKVLLIMQMVYQQMCQHMLWALCRQML